MCNSGGSHETWSWCRHSSQQWGIQTEGCQLWANSDHYGLHPWEKFYCPKSFSYISGLVFRTRGTSVVKPLPLPSSGPSVKYLILSKKEKSFFPLCLWINICHHVTANADIFCTAFSRSLQENKSSQCHQSFSYASKNIFSKYSVHYLSSRRLGAKADMQRYFAI